MLLAWLLFFLVTPPFQVPDENSHYDYVQSLVSGNYPVLPPPDPTGMFNMQDSGMSQEILRVYRTRELGPHPDQVINSAHPSIDETKSDNVDTSVQAYQPPVYYWIASLFYRFARFAGLSGLGIYFATRISSLVFYLLFLAVFWRFFRTLLPDREADYLTLAVAFQPTLLMVAASVNPEIGAIALFTLVFAVLLMGLRSGTNKLTFGILLGILSAAAVLTKFTDIILLPLVVLGLALFSKCGWEKKWRLIAAYLIPTVALLTPWFVFNLQHYHQLLPHNLEILYPRNSTSYSLSSLLFFTLQDLKEALYGIPGNFSFLQAPMFLELRVIYIFVFLVFASAGIWFFLRQGATRIFHRPVGFIAIAAVAFLTLFLAAYSLFMKMNFQSPFGLQGRYFLEGLLPAAILFYAGLRRALRVSKPESLARGLFFLSFLYFMVSILYILVPRFYV